MSKRRSREPANDQRWKTLLLIIAALGGLVTTVVTATTFVRDTWFETEDARPDLRVSADMPLCPFDQEGAGEIKVENVGPSDVGPALITVQDFLNPKDTQALAAPVPGHGEAVFGVHYPPCADGDCLFVLDIDPNDQIDESNESNNHWIGTCPVITEGAS